MTPHLPVLPCRACGVVERPHLTTGPSGTFVAYCASCGSRIKALPYLTMPQLPSGAPRSRHTTVALAHPVLLAQRCRHCGEVNIPRINPGKGPHAAAAVCPHCTGFLQWVKKTVMAQLKI